MILSDSPRRRIGRTGIDTVVLDLDGTLVDSVFQHVVAWQAAFRDVGLEIPGARIQRTIGMGGDRLVKTLAGEAAERAVGDQVRMRHDEHFEERLHDVRALAGASELLERLHGRGYKLVLASSGERAITDRLLGLVEARDVFDAVTSGSDAAESKPAPDLISAALEAVDASSGIVIGDAVWDVQAALAAGVAAIGLLSGGIAESELVGAGASRVYAGPQELLDRLEDSLLG